eukprot:scaffold27690_cov63-Phaeocystis_antarctica.AAC.7
MAVWVHAGGPMRTGERTGPMHWPKRALFWRRFVAPTTVPWGHGTLSPLKLPPPTITRVPDMQHDAHAYEVLIDADGRRWFHHRWGNALYKREDRGRAGALACAALESHGRGLPHGTVPRHAGGDEQEQVRQCLSCDEADGQSSRPVDAARTGGAALNIEHGAGGAGRVAGRGRGRVVTARRHGGCQGVPRIAADAPGTRRTCA